MTTEELVKINRDFFTKAAGIAAKTAIFMAIPYLDVPPVNFLINRVVDWIVNQIADGLELSAFFIYIDLRVSKQGKEYVIASYNANKFQTEELRKIADEKFKAFVKFSS